MMDYPGSLFVRKLDDGRVIVVYPALYTTRLCIGPDDEQTYDDAWCYEHSIDAMTAAETWDGQGNDPPCGWHRHIGTGRRRTGGDPKREYVMP